MWIRGGAHPGDSRGAGPADAPGHPGDVGQGHAGPWSIEEALSKKLKLLLPTDGAGPLYPNQQIEAGEPTH